MPLNGEWGVLAKRPAKESRRAPKQSKSPSPAQIQQKSNRNNNSQSICSSPRSSHRHGRWLDQSYIRALSWPAAAHDMAQVPEAVFSDDDLEKRAIRALGDRKNCW